MAQQRHPVDEAQGGHRPIYVVRLAARLDQIKLVLAHMLVVELVERGGEILGVLCDRADAKSLRLRLWSTDRNGLEDASTQWAERLFGHGGRSRLGREPANPGAPDENRRLSGIERFCGGWGLPRERFFIGPKLPLAKATFEPW